MTFRLLPLLAAATLALASLHAAAAPESAEVAQARELIDSYFGNRNNLDQAAKLLRRAYDRDPKDAHIYVQAARATIKGGHLSFDNFRPGAVESYAALLDRALGLDPGNAKAHILKAEVFNMSGRHEDELRELDAAKAAGTTDPWLLLGYARYYRYTKQPALAYTMARTVEERGPGKTTSERNAFVQALDILGDFKLGDEDVAEKGRGLAARALKERHPADAWTPLGWAEDFLDREQFGDAVVYAREALKTMKFPAAYTALASSLYADAAQKIMRGASEKSPEIQALLKDAQAQGVDRDQVLTYVFQRRAKQLGVYRPTMERIVR